MKSNIVARKYEVTDPVRDRLDKKLAKLDKFFPSEITANVSFSSKRGRDKVEITIFYKSLTYRAEVIDPDVILAIDKAVSIIERQIRKNKTKLEKRLRDNAFAEPADQEFADVTEETVVISRSKKLELQPMSTEEAVLQMNLTAHDFFVYRDLENKIKIVYKRYDGDYGQLEIE